MDNNFNLKKFLIENRQVNEDYYEFGTPEKAKLVEFIANLADDKEVSHEEIVIGIQGFLQLIKFDDNGNIDTLKPYDDARQELNEEEADTIERPVDVYANESLAMLESLLEDIRTTLKGNQKLAKFFNEKKQEFKLEKLYSKAFEYGHKEDTLEDAAFELVEERDVIKDTINRKNRSTE